MSYKLTILIALLAFTGCSKHEEPSTALPASAPSESAKSRHMAYERSIYLDVREDKISSVYEVAQAACREAASDQCIVLESRLDMGLHASATLKFRARPSGIQKILAALTAQGGVTNQSTTAEDLARPIEDASRKFAMLHDYQSRLEALRDRAGGNIDSLIKVNKELAQVQSELETLAGQKAFLVRRVETEVLNVDVTSVHQRSFWSPISLALANFGSNLSNGLSSAITAVAYIIPWSLMLLAIAWGGRKLWGRLKRAKANA